MAALAERPATTSPRCWASTRGAIGMVRCARVWAAAQGRNFVLPDDIAPWPCPWAHRIIADPDAFSPARPLRASSSALTRLPAVARNAP